jgi:glucose-6-phosphate 1-dehydrogenase
VIAGAVEPSLFIIIGGTGDLTRRKLLPALCRLAMQGHLPSASAVLGVARDERQTDAGFRAWAREALVAAGRSPREAAAWCDARLHYQPLASGSPDDYARLAARIASIERERGLPGNRAFYLAMPPAAVPATLAGLGGAGLSDAGRASGGASSSAPRDDRRGRAWTRLVIEKPFGRDLASARELNAIVHRTFDESQVYRIDHYLGKETVQNLLVFRFSNAIFESLWNRDKVECVQITVAEEIGVGSRSGYYDNAGALRDMVQNHATQLVSLIAMEVPAAFEADAIRYEKVKALRQIAPPLAEDIVLGQYARGSVGGRDVPGYREEAGVAADSDTETFVAMRLEVDSWRWQGVPFFVRTGKRLATRLTQIAVRFRRAPVCLFQMYDSCQIHSNVLLMTLQPEEGFSLYFDVKRPGEPFTLEALPLRFKYEDAFGALPEAYETLLLDVLTGDQTLFVNADEVEASWHLYDPLVSRKKGDPLRDVRPYAAGTWGPPEAERLLARHKSRWFAP